VPPLLEEEEAEEVALAVEEYQPPDLSEEEAIRMQCLWRKKRYVDFFFGYSYFLID
jgi:hypothetical protein